MIDLINPTTAEDRFTVDFRRIDNAPELHYVLRTVHLIRTWPDYAAEVARRGLTEQYFLNLAHTLGDHA